MQTWDELTVVEQLQSTYSDFYKDVHGVRPRFATDEQWNSQTWLEAQINDLKAYCDTPAYKEQQEAQEEYYDQMEQEYRESMQENAELAELLAPATLIECYEASADADAQVYGIKG